MSIKIHILNHTHWDREWFLTSAYTSQWIPNLIDRLCELKEKNKNYKFLLDGQTLVIRDLLEVAPEYKQKVVDLTASGSLIVGPYYCQPDWRLADGESLIRNLSYGLRDIQQSGGIGAWGGWSITLAIFLNHPNFTGYLGLNMHTFGEARRNLSHIFFGAALMEANCSRLTCLQDIGICMALRMCPKWLSTGWKQKLIV